jgi:hypothetical protein
MKLSDELIELRRNFQIKKIEERNPNFFANLRNELKANAENGLNTFNIELENLPDSVPMSVVEEWTELNGMEFNWETTLRPFRISF